MTIWLFDGFLLLLYDSVKLFYICWCIMSIKVLKKSLIVMHCQYKIILHMHLIMCKITLHFDSVYKFDGVYKLTSH
jgi:hypothetical protein